MRCSESRATYKSRARRSLLIAIAEPVNVKSKYGPKSNWYRTLFGAMNAPTLSEVLSQPVTFVTFNYDRSLEHFLAEALRVKFTPGPDYSYSGLD